jgi:hypothetical protein
LGGFLFARRSAAPPGRPYRQHENGPGAEDAKAVEKEN